MSEFVDRFLHRAITILSRYEDKRKVKSYIRGISNSYNKLPIKTELTKDQEREIQEYYTRLLGHPVPLEWHRYFTSRTGNYSKLYIPTSEYKSNIIGRLNVFPLKRAYTDKNITDLLLPHTHQPHVFLKNMNGFFYFDGEAVTKERALELCANLGEVIIKPSLTGRGKGVKRVNIINGVVDSEGKTLAQLFDEYKTDYLVEAVVQQHDAMSALNPSSVNTIRIVTYRSGMDILVVYTVIRIGRKNQTIDNESAGGISTIIHEDGSLGKYAYGVPGCDRIEYTDAGVKLEGYKIPSYQSAVNIAKESHLQLPCFKLMGWDFAIEKDGTPVLIEFNMTPDLSQSANGPAFGDKTEMILKDAKNHQNTWSMAAVDCIWKKTTRIK